MFRISADLFIDGIDPHLVTVNDVKLTSLKHSKVEMDVLGAEMLVNKIEIYTINGIGNPS